jgi:hypothetical protein
MQELNMNVGILIGRYVDTQNPLFLRLFVTSKTIAKLQCLGFAAYTWGMRTGENPLRQRRKRRKGLLSPPEPAYSWVG